MPVTPNADHPRFLEVVLGRLLDLAIHSFEGVRSRLRQPTVH